MIGKRDRLNEVYILIYFPPITTDRLVLRVLTPDDAEQVFKHFSDPEVTAFMDIEPCRSIREAEEIIQFHVEDNGCRYGLFSKDNGSLIGTCGYHCWVRDEESRSRAEIGFDLAKAYWGQGYMKEVLAPMLRIGFDVMKLAYIEATVEEANVRCRRLLEACQFVREEELRERLIYYKLISRPTE
ncbi:GNAT family N-acetyltransferase [Paenibacillus lignilyticus]|uniref:GNAT family N-acetyltransferase n=1 Tax=Paenibacillus lignilyticus TaxID=1172615 RepID=A0ABS5C7B2_9BACL|nr:GNAT family N-acetyltransferase [Paenibacillus lignilyticus]MBP3961891.1 GNAT family N-acetyltransferase [Paenibacillus lignilyticus]